MRLLLLTALVASPLFAQMPTSARWPRERPAVFVDLSYPPDALAARATGPVAVRVGTDASGRVVSAEALSGSDRLTSAVLANVRQWTLSPGARSEVVVYRFEIDPAPCNDDSRSLFRLARPNLAVITACTGPGRGWIPPPPDQLEFASTGERAIYPPIAFNARVTGVVILELSLDEKGMVVDSRPLTQLPLLTEAAVAHSKTWRFRPTERRRGIIVYEFAQDLRNCSADAPTDFWRVTADFYRLSTCSPFVER